MRESERAEKAAKAPAKKPAAKAAGQGAAGGKTAPRSRASKAPREVRRQVRRRQDAPPRRLPRKSARPQGMKLLVVAVGQRVPDWAQTAWDDYAKRFPPELRLELKAVKTEPRGSQHARAS